MRWSLLVVLGVLVVLGGCGEPPPAAKDQEDVKEPRDHQDEVPGVGRVVVDWRRWQEPPTEIVIGVGGVAAGPAGGPLVPHLFLAPERAEDAHFFARTYRPFRARLGRGELAFHGRGPVRPGAAERRMIVEWARRVAAEQVGGRSGGAYGLALSWHRGGSLGSCASVSVFLTGEAWAQACAWSGDEVRGRLQPAAAGRIYEWFDALAPFQMSEPGSSGEIEPSRLVFAGRGTRPAGDADRTAIESFAAALFRELSARRRGVAPLLAETPAGRSAAGAPPSEPAGPRLLLPPARPRASPPLARLAPEIPPKPPPLSTASAASGSRGPAAPPP